MGGFPVDAAPAPAVGRLHQVAPTGRTRTVFDGLQAANGIGWSPDAQTTYLVDSGRCLIHRLGPGPDGRLARRHPPLRLRRADGVPDGLTVDAAGCLWVALWDGAAVVRISPDGTELDRRTLPCSRPTACALVGRRLVITTARVAGEDLSGGLFAVDVDVPGPPARRAV